MEPAPVSMRPEGRVMNDLKERIEQGFSAYAETLRLVDQLIVSKSNVQEIILLVCARIDSLSHLMRYSGSDKDRFTHFLARYSYFGRRAWAVSTPDLYDSLCCWRWLLPFYLPAPGRLQVFDQTRDERFINFLWESGVPITDTEVSSLLSFLLRTLKQKYRVVPKQARAKPALDVASGIQKLLARAAATPRRKRILQALKFVMPMLKEFSLGALLYKEYRCRVIHEYAVDIDESVFFRGKDVLWRAVYHVWEPDRPALQVVFPAAVLRKLLATGLGRFIQELEHRRRLPADVFLDLCHPIRELEFLDQDSISPGKALRPR